MKTDFIFKTMLLIALACLPFVSTSCSDEEVEQVTTIHYSMGFEELATSDRAELGVIEAAFQQALGVSSNSFTLPGTISECDGKVKSACLDAENTLKAKTFKGKYTFVVTNFTSQKKIYSYQIN